MTRHHPGRHACCCHCRLGVDDDLWALGELLVAPFLALATLARWTVRHPAGAALVITIVTSAAIVVLAVTS